MSDKMKLIAIEGLIRRDNAALANAMGQKLNARVICDSDQVGPLVNIASQDPKDFQFKKHMLRLVDRYKAQRRLWQTDIFHEYVISDYLFYADRIYANVTLSPDDLPLYEHVIDFMEKEIAIPDLVIYLQRPADAVAELLAPQETGKKNKIASVNGTYIQSLCDEFNEFFLWYRWSPVLIVNANQFDPDRPEHVQDLLSKIQKPFSGVLYYNPPGIP